MARIIHARLDVDSEKILKEVQQRLGWSDSQTIREGIKALRALLPRTRRRKIVGLGRFRSGEPDLGSNKRNLEGFGR